MATVCGNFVAQNLYCKCCDYLANKKYNFDKHLLTGRHAKNATWQQMATNGNGFVAFCGNFTCLGCHKKYNDRSGLWKHQKKCTIVNKVNIEKENSEKIIDYHNDIKKLSDLVIDVVKQNQNLTDKIVDLCKNNNNIQNNINSNNKTFNLSIFLNEYCKDAMNIMDFVDSLKLQLDDLESVGKLGFVEGISNIIVKKLQEMDISKRPVHCSDSKREVMYIKDENKWEKENEQKAKLRKAIKYIAHKNSKLIPEFKAKYPDCCKSTSKYSDKLNKLVVEAMGGAGDNDYEKEDKIIQNIAKEVIIDKNSNI